MQLEMSPSSSLFQRSPSEMRHGCGKRVGRLPKSELGLRAGAARAATFAKAPKHQAALLVRTSEPQTVQGRRGIHQLSRFGARLPKQLRAIAPISKSNRVGCASILRDGATFVHAPPRGWCSSRPEHDAQLSNAQCYSSCFV